MPVVTMKSTSKLKPTWTDVNVSEKTIRAMRKCPVFQALYCCQCCFSYNKDIFKATGLFTSNSTVNVEFRHCEKLGCNEKPFMCLRRGRLTRHYKVLKTDPVVS